MRSKHRRSGLFITELIASLTLLGLIASIVVTLSMLVGEQRRTAELRADLLEEARNIFEDARSRPPESLDGAWARSRHPSEEVAARHPELELQVLVDPEPGHPRMRHVTVTLRAGVNPRTFTRTYSASFAPRSVEVQP